MVQVFLFLALFVHRALGSDYAIECLNGIRTAVSEFAFVDNENGTYWTGICNDTLGVYSLWAAAKIYCTPEEIIAGSNMLGEYCEEYGGVPLTPYATLLPNLTDAYINSLQVVDYADIDESIVWNNSVLLSKDLFTSARRTTYGFANQYVIHQTYGWAMYGYWGGLLLFGIFYRFGTYIYNAQLGRNTRDIETVATSGVYQSKPSGILDIFWAPYHWIRTNLVIPAAFGSHHQQLLWSFSIPTRMETLVLFLYYALSIILCSISYDIFWPNLYYTPRLQRLRYIADRTGIISYANLPILWMFSGRNNVFLWATGWSFSTFNSFHRHVARVATAQAIIHSVCYSVLEADFGGLAESWKENYWYMGGMATIAMSLILAFSSVFLRKKAYEIFLLIHIALSVVTIVGLFYHTAIFDGEYDPYLWPLVAIWVFDRAARLARLAYCNIHVGLSGNVHHTKSTATYDKESDMIRLEVIPGSMLLKPKPNQHYYLYQPGTLRCWENHPFTLAHWEEVRTSSPSTSLTSSNTTFTNTKSNSNTKIATSSSSLSSTTPDSPIDQSPDTTTKSDSLTATTGSNRLLFYIRPFNGWTQRLRSDCLRKPSSITNPTILIEGPYGHSAPLHAYENIVFITGGTGIAGATAYLTDHLARSATGTTCTTNITLLWATKQAAMIRAIAAKELAPVRGRNDVCTSFYTTGRHEVAASLETKTPDDATSGSLVSDVEITYGRPNIAAVLQGVIDVVAAAGSKGGRIAVLVCGPAGMADEARSAVHKALKDGRRGVEYLEETFGW